MPKIYFDHNATTPLAPEAFAAMKPYLTESYGNASSIHWAGERVKRGLEEARGKVANLIGANPKEIVFTSGATESINTVLKGNFSPGLGPKNQLTISAVEHRATLEAAETLVSWGISVNTIPVDGEGRIDPDDVAKSITPETRLVSILWANNEIGNIYPVEKIAALCQERGVLFHVDAAQAAGKVEIDLRQVPIDFLSLSAHKIYGPQGVGALYIRETPERVARDIPLAGRAFRPTPDEGMSRRQDPSRWKALRRFHDGGAQERNRRGGTENIAGIVGFGAAASVALERLVDDKHQATFLIEHLRQGIQERLPEVIFYGDPEERIANTLCVGFPGITSEALLIALDLAGIATSSGSACSSGTIEPSHVLLAMGASAEEAQSAIRFSVGRQNRIEEIDILLKTLPHIVSQLKAA